MNLKLKEPIAQISQSRLVFTLQFIYLRHSYHSYLCILNIVFRYIQQIQLKGQCHGSTARPKYART
jgi:hypothetical protein